VISVTFNFSCWKVTDSLAACMFETQMTIIISSYFASTFWGPIFLLLVLPLRWFENEVSGMFQYLTAFNKEMCPFSIVTMASSRSWSIHLACLIAIHTLFILVDLCIYTMGGWHCCYVGAWTGCDCGVFCIVGDTLWRLIILLCISGT
jgi:hypothetical protein